MQTRKHVICRACQAQCGLIVDFENGRPVATHGDKGNPVYFGYSCIKGRDYADDHASPNRLWHSQTRTNDGTYRDIGWQTAAAEIAQKLKPVIETHGPNSVALYLGTFGFNNFCTHAFAHALMRAIGSDMLFNPASIDQPGKAIAAPLHGPWLAGPYRPGESDGILLVGTNPLVSMNGGLGMNPARMLHEGKKRGMQLIVIDPRKTESAQKADLHLQAKPGQDAVILAAMARQIIEDNLYDKDFVAEDTQGFDALKAALAPFTPQAAAAQAGLTPDEIIKAARMQATWQKGSVSVGTGPNMAGFGNIAEYMGLVLTSLLGQWRRAGEVRGNSGVFIKPFPPIAATPGPGLALGYGKKLRTRGLEQTAAGLPTGALADEILTAGEGQVKALFVIGGNPMLTWPDQIKTKAAMEALDLLVSIDPRMSKTSQLADYVIAPKMPYEAYGTTALMEYLGNFVAGWGFEQSYGQISEPILSMPDDSDICDEYAFLHAIAAGLGKPLEVTSLAPVIPAEAAGQTTQIDLETCPEPLEAWDAALKGAACKPSELYKDPEAHKGKLVEDQGTEIMAKPDGWLGKLDLASPLLMEELGEVAETLAQAEDTPAYPFRLISRRLTELHNSNWHENASQHRKRPHQVAFMNPADLADLELDEGDAIKVTSERATIQCIVEPADDIRRGCLSVPHGWGGSGNQPSGNTNLLIFNDRDYDKHTGIPRMSAIPVQVKSLSLSE